MVALCSPGTAICGGRAVTADALAFTFRFPVSYKSSLNSDIRVSPIRILRLPMRLFPLGRGDLAFDGECDAVGAGHPEACSIASNLIGYCSAIAVDSGMDAARQRSCTGRTLREWHVYTRYDLLALDSNRGAEAR